MSWPNHLKVKHIVVYLCYANDLNRELLWTWAVGCVIAVSGMILASHPCAVFQWWRDVVNVKPCEGRWDQEASARAENVDAKGCCVPVGRCHSTSHSRLIIRVTLSWGHSRLIIRVSLSWGHSRLIIGVTLSWSLGWSSGSLWAEVWAWWRVFGSSTFRLS